MALISFSNFEKNTNIFFTNKDLLKQAFTHRSYVNESHKSKLSHNERLEFLGDAVLELITTDFLYEKYPQYNEGELTAIRSSLVNSTTLSSVASDLGMNDYLLLSKGEYKDVGRARQCILANTYESYIGALYLDQGYSAAESFILNTLLLPKTDEIVKTKSWKDAKSIVQEKAQEELNITPSYNLLKESGPDHNKSFTIGIYFGDELIANGVGKSKQEAEQKAAEVAIKLRHWSK